MAASTPKNPGGARTPKSAPRYAVDPNAFFAEGKTIGSQSVYRFAVENVSKTGLLLIAAENEDVPFRANTIIELTLDPQGNLMGGPVSCLAKVIRAEVPGGQAVQKTVPRCGVTIVQIEPAQQARLDRFIEDLAESNDWRFDGSNGQYWLKRA